MEPSVPLRRRGPSPLRLDKELAFARVRSRLLGAELVAPSIGRFQVEELLGRGGMGAVYRCLDPELGRHVAVKVIQGDADPNNRERLLREAQALAKLPHPNVVTIYEVGSGGEEAVWIAMELIAGVTLEQWAQTERTWRETASVYLQAARGLAAAHAVDIVHRDFKPANAILGDDGVVRVLDFGLAQGARVAEPVRDVVELERLTETGAVMGTPAYMSPEQMNGQVVDAASDQFSFCVGLFEALYGERPYRGKTLEQLRASMQARALARPTGARVPRGLQRLVERGLQPNPSQRHPSMAAVVDALERLLRPRRIWPWSSAGAAVAASVALGLVLTRPQPSGGPTCTGFEREIAGAWTGEDRAMLVAAVGPTHGERIASEIDAGIEEWTTLRRQACLDSTRGDTELGRRRLVCLTRKRQQLASWVDVLAEAKAEVPGWLRAPALDLHECRDEATVLAKFEPPPDDKREAVEALDARIERVWAFYQLGQTSEALELAEAVRVDAAELRYPPTESRAAYQLGTVLLHEEYNERGVEVLNEALVSAEAGGDDHARAAALIQLAAGLSKLRRHEQARRSLDVAQAILERLEGGPGNEMAKLELLRADLEVDAGRYEDGIPHARRALELHADSEHPLPDMGWRANNLLATIDYRLGKGEEAMAAAEEAVRIIDAMGGPTYPKMAAVWTNLGAAATLLGDLDAAQAAFQRGLDIRRELGRADDPSLANPLMNIAAIAIAREDYASAETSLEDAEALWTEAYGADHPKLAVVRHNQAKIARAKGEPARALELHLQGLALRQEGLGRAHELTASSWQMVADAQVEVGRFDEALRSANNCESISREALGDEAPSLAYCMGSQAQALAGLGERGAARKRALAGLALAKDPQAKAWLEELAGP